jgi:predicted kinase
LTIVVITGAIASGKSTVAREVARQLEGIAVRAVVIDLDAVHDELVASGSDPDDASWIEARRRTAILANELSRDGVAVVVAEGSFNVPSDRVAFVSALDDHAPPLFVTLQVSFEEALRRAQLDPTRGRSRDPGFLGPYFAGRRDALVSAPATDVVIDTERTTASAAAEMIIRHVQATIEG